MGWFDTVVREACHEIFGVIAMQHTQFNVVQTSTILLMLALTVPWAVRASAGTVHNAQAFDPLLDTDKKGPCAALTAGPDYTAGTDADGNPVAPADVASTPMPVPDQIAIPLRNHSPGDSAYVSLDGRKLAPLLNPPACNR